MSAEQNRLSPLSVLGLTAFAMCAFAANSILCRVALNDALIDPFGFAVIRVLAAACMLWLVVQFNNSNKVGVVITQDKANRSALKRNQAQLPAHRLWLGAVFLSGYLLAFSWAYLSLTTASGAILLFGSVQLTLLLSSLIMGYRPSPWQWLGFILALSSFAWWLWPQTERPDMWAAVAMIGAGLSWAFYTQVGHSSQFPLFETYAYFLRAIVCVTLISVFFIGDMFFTSSGIVLALISGACASALGYVAWFVILPYLNLLGAGVVQLLVPMLAALAGIVFASELPSSRLWVSIVCITLGLALVIFAKSNHQSQNSE